jgi:carbamoyl-phosphate synthase large subunit
VVDDIIAATRKLALELGVLGLMNVQYAVKAGQVYVIEVNPRASRTVPFVSKAIGRPLAKLAALVMAGQTLEELGLTSEVMPKHFSVKEAVFPFVKFPGVDTLLGPEMKSTGEVMGIDSDFGRAYSKAQIQSGNSLPLSGTALVSVRSEEHERVVVPVRKLVALGFDIIATEGTANALSKAGIEVKRINKVHEGSPHTVELIDAEDVALVINTVAPEAKAIADSLSMRRAALVRGIPYCTTLAAARASADAIAALQKESIGVRSLQEIHARM